MMQWELGWPSSIADVATEGRAAVFVKGSQFLSIF